MSARPCPACKRNERRVVVELCAHGRRLLQACSERPDDQRRWRIYEQHVRGVPYVASPRELTPPTR